MFFASVNRSLTPYALRSRWVAQVGDGALLTMSHENFTSLTSAGGTSNVGVARNVGRGRIRE